MCYGTESLHSCMLRGRPWGCLLFTSPDGCVVTITGHVSGSKVGIASGF